MVRLIQYSGDDAEVRRFLEACSLEVGIVSYRPAALSEDRVCFQPQIDAGLAFHSFAPVVGCAVRKQGDSTALELSFLPSKSVRIIAGVLAVLSFLFEIVFACLYFAVESLSVTALAAPLLLLLLLSCFLAIGLRIACSRFTKALLHELTEHGFRAIQIKSERSR